MGNDFRGLRERFAKEYKQRSIDVQTNMLLEYAPKMLKKAYQNSTFINRTFNLADSYVWIVYYKGEVKGSGFLWNSKRANANSEYNAQKIDGRALASNFVSSRASSYSNGWEVVWAAIAPYSYNLETGESRPRRFYVVSSIFDEVNFDFKGKGNVTVNL